MRSSFWGNRKLLLRQIATAWLILLGGSVLFSVTATLLPTHSDETAIVVAALLVTPVVISLHLWLFKRDYQLLRKETLSSASASIDEWLLTILVGSLTRLTSGQYTAAKRIMDLLMLELALPLLLPLMALCALAIRLDSSGPSFHVQERIGKGARPFHIYKFRTMYVNASPNTRGDITIEVDKPAQDQYITRVGRILRKMSLDELPQLINVLKGEMSLVGPRPMLRREVEESQLWHHERLNVLPGLTGLAQILGKVKLSREDELYLDAVYAKRQSLTLDASLLLITVPTVLTNKTWALERVKNELSDVPEVRSAITRFQGVYVESRY